MEFTNFIDPALLVLIPVLLVLGKIIKDYLGGVDSRYIPLILGVLGVLLAILWVLPTSLVSTWQDVMLAAFTAFVQGILCAGAAVYGNQIYKQLGEKGE